MSLNLFVTKIATKHHW